MTSTLTTTAATLYAAICRDPEDDTLRLAFADALDDAGDHDRAEFVRMGVELANRPPLPEIEVHLTQFPNTLLCVGLANKHQDLVLGKMVTFRHQERDDSWYKSEPVRVAKIADFDSGRFEVTFAKVDDPLRAREAQLLAAHGDGWRRGEVCPECNGIFCRTLVEADGTGRRVWLDCPKCRGTGYTSPLYGRVLRVDTSGVHWDGQFRRGLIAQYSATHSEVFDATGPSEWACDVARAFPVERVVITDARVWPSGGNDTYYVGNLGFFPKEYWKRLDNLPSRSAAHDALAQATAEWVRAKAFEEQR